MSHQRFWQIIYLYCTQNTSVTHINYGGYNVQLRSLHHAKQVFSNFYGDQKHPISMSVAFGVDVDHLQRLTKYMQSKTDMPHISLPIFSGSYHHNTVGWMPLIKLRNQ